MSFRRMLTLLAVAFLFAGIAAAQAGDTQPFTCSTVAQVTPTLRSEGITELVGDIVITCNGGAAFMPTVNAPYVPTANITVSLTNKITSRLVSGQVSEALLLVDEPGSTTTRVVVPGYGPNAALKLCGSPTNPLQGGLPGTCSQLVKWVNKDTGVTVFYSKNDGKIYNAAGTLQTDNTVVNNANYIQVGYNADAADPTVTPSLTSNTLVNNAFQGVVVGNNQVQFQGIPVLPPVTSGVSRVYRITNIRVNAGNSVPVNGVTVVTQVIAYLSNSGSTSLPVNQSGITVGFVQGSLNLNAANNYGVYKVNTFTQCDLTKNLVAAGYPQMVGVLRFGELFPSAFKTRLAPVSTVGITVGGVGTTTSSIPTSTFTSADVAKQNVPGTIYSSESGFVMSSAIGLADYGTRLQAKFTGLPKGVKVYVTRTNVTGIAYNKLDSTSAAAWAPAAAPLSTNILTTSYAEWTAPATNSQLADKAAFSPAGNTGSPVSVNLGGGAMQLIDVTPGTYDTTGQGTSAATWEVLAANASTNEDFNFLVFISYAPAAGTPSLPVVDTNASASLWYGDQSTVDVATTSWNGIFQTGAQIPRFGQGGTASSLFTIGRCSTVLLFPYVTTNGGYDTGVAISNTSADPLGTPVSTADVKCDVTPYGAWYNGTTLVSVSTAPKWTVTVQPGQTTAGLLSSSLGAAPTGTTGFSGYLFAQCNFQFAHGFAFITNLGTGSLGQTMGYLALIVNNGATNVTIRNGSLYGEALNN